MIALKAGRNCKHVGTMPLFRALVFDGVIYYLIFIIAISVEIFAKTSSEVGILMFIMQIGPLRVENSYIIP